jgi:tRNA isopentenyl-2-thiomethyl-A-37 hydroxylase MiaE
MATKKASRGARKTGASTAGKSARKKPTDLGTNRTGVQTAPARTKEMSASTEAAPAEPMQADAIARVRAELAQEAPPIGTMPVPGNVRGVAKTLGKALQGEKASVFLDKLGERLAFERSGVRLYDAVLAKMPASRLSEGTLTIEEMRRFRDEELAHMHLVKEALESAGGDPTAVTPCADVAGVQGIGILQVLTDPRTTLTQCLDALLTAELADNDGWKILIAMAEAAGEDELAERFTQALAEEDHHLASVRTWIAERLGIQLGKPLPSTDFGEPAQPA